MTEALTPSLVTAVSLNGDHTFSKVNQPVIRLVAGYGVEGDAHFGTTVKHRYLVKKDPTRKNLRQVHLIHEELFAELRERGFSVSRGELGENVTTRGIDLLTLPAGTRLRLGADAVVEITGLRNPCIQIDQFQQGLVREVLVRDTQKKLIRKTGVMSIVLTAGDVRPGDTVMVDMPAQPHRALEPV